MTSEAIGNVAVRRPREVLDLLKTFVGEDSVQTDEALEMRAECTWLLGFVGKHSDFLNEMLPLLYAGLVDCEQLVRAWAIEGLREVAEAHPADAIPVEFQCDAPGAAQRQVRDRPQENHPCPCARRSRAARAPPLVVHLLVSIADYYAKTDDSDTLDDALRAIQMWGTDHDNPAATLAINRVVARFARKLDAHDLMWFLEAKSAKMLGLPEYAEALVYALQRLDIVHEPNSGDSRIEILSVVPAASLAPHAAGLYAAAMAHLPRNPWSALEYVEVFQRLLMWAEAVRLADDVVAATPTTVDHAVKRTYAEYVRSMARLEAAVAAGTTGTSHLLQDSRTAARAYEQARANAKTNFPWPT